MTDEVKDKIQKEALQAIEDNNGRGIIVIATGGGKTRIPILYALEHNIPGEKIALIVPTEELRDDDWRKEFEICNCLEIFNKLDRYCYKSINKISDKEYDLVILDECHHITELNFEFFKNNKVKSLLALTATLPTNVVKKDLLKSLNLNPIYSISLDEAQDIDLISSFSIEVRFTTLDDTDKYILAGSKEKKFYTTEKKMYNYLSNKIREIKGDDLDLGEFAIRNSKILTASEKKRVEMLTFQRMRILYNSKNKRLLTKEYLKDIPKEERVLIFCGSIEQAKEICEHTYHSKSGRKDLSDFIEGKINRLSCVRALDEGKNIPNLDRGLIIQVLSKDLNLIQRIGRTVRKRENHKAKITILCCKDTQDEVWLAKALKGINSDKIKYYGD